MEVENNGISTMLNDLLIEAFERGASDIHIEPREEFVRVRYRIDGLLQEAKPVPKDKQQALTSKIKVMVNLDIAETRLPQDGRTELKLKKENFDLRVSTIPTIHGEKIVIRMLPRRPTHLNLEALGMEKEDLALYRSIISRKNGMVLVTGPTGSGKTTTLYATLATLNRKEVNIMTIEDPVEYQLPGINQIQVNPKIGLTFTKGLRHILRQDPDIIMIGEIRDLETAKVAVQAALTGHLVFSTLHTNDAPSAVTRLLEMGIEKYLVEATVLGVVAQRLVRRITPEGYRGRIGIYQIMSGTTPSKNLKTLFDDGLIKVEKGLTTREELARAVSLES